MDEPLEHLYFNWLCAKVLRIEVPTPSLTYWKLLRKLYSTEFVWLLSGDDNRVEDGLELRDEFLLESGFPEDEEWRRMGCSILEMFIAFTRAAEFTAGETPSFWFWRFIENLGLIEFNDSAYNEEVVSRQLFDFVWRDYDYNGTGGMFPLSNPDRDQRGVEIWYQFNAYLQDTDWPL